jgi:hypothetical protein
VFYRRLDESEGTFIKGVETDDLYFEVAVEGHLSVDVLAKGGLACCRPTCHAYQYLLVGLVDKALLASAGSSAKAHVDGYNTILNLSLHRLLENMEVTKTVLVIVRERSGEKCG